jgi:hypothetical protein
MNYFIGLEKSWLQKCPSNKHIMRLADSLTIDETRELYIHFNLDSRPSQKWENMEYRYSQRSVAELHFFALMDWINKSKTPTFSELFSLFEEFEIMTCVLCEVSVN